MSKTLQGYQGYSLDLAGSALVWIAVTWDFSPWSPFKEADWLDGVCSHHPAPKPPPTLHDLIIVGLIKRSS